VQLDTGKGQEPQSITFTVGDDAEAGEFNKFKLGYADVLQRSMGPTEMWACKQPDTLSPETEVPSSRNVALSWRCKPQQLCKLALPLKTEHFRACHFGPVARRDKRPKPRCVFAMR